MANTEISYRLNIFDVLKNIDIKNRNYYKTLTEDERKALNPYVIMRWLSGTSSAKQVFFLNVLVNPYIFALQNHKDLLLELMMVCTSGKSKHYHWLKQPKNKSSGKTKLVNLIKEYFGYNTKHAIDILPILSDEDLLSYAEQLGYQKPEITALKRELKNR